MNKDFSLFPGEQLCWEGRPAPRCFTFRHWRHSIFGVVFLAICSYWQLLGVQMAESYAISWLAWVPIPFVLLGIYFSVGHLFQARLEWNNVYYAITDQRLVVRRGLMSSRVESMNLADVTYLTVHGYGQQLGTLRVYRGEQQKLILHCLEHPRAAVMLLEEAIKQGRTTNQGHAPQVETTS